MMMIKTGGMKASPTNLPMGPFLTGNSGLKYPASNHSLISLELKEDSKGSESRCQLDFISTERRLDT